MNPCEDDVCVTCRDELRRVRVIALAADGRSMARVEDGGQEWEVAIDLVDGVGVGDVLLVHGGVALQREETGR